MSNKTNEDKTLKVPKKGRGRKQNRQQLNVLIGGEVEPGVISRPYWVDKQRWAEMTDEERLALVEPDNINPAL